MMDWQLTMADEKSEDQEENAYDILQMYIKSLQDKKALLSILSDYSVLDYFGKRVCGPEEIASLLMTHLQGSNYEVSNLSISEDPNISVTSVESNCDHSNEEDLGVSLLSPPKTLFPSLSFETPVRRLHSDSINCDSSRRALKRTAKDASLEGLIGNLKMSKLDSEKPNRESNDVPDDARYITAYGTIRFAKRVTPTSDPKRIKRHTMATPRDRFCQLQLGYKNDDLTLVSTSCKFWLIKYSISSKVTPRNLLKSFNEVEPE